MHGLENRDLLQAADSFSLQFSATEEWERKVPFGRRTVFFYFNQAILPSHLRPSGLSLKSFELCSAMCSLYLHVLTMSIWCYFPRQYQFTCCPRIQPKLNIQLVLL